MHEEMCCGDMTWVCIAGNCDGCHLRSVCDQPCSYIDGHLEEVIEATCNQFKRCISELKEHMEQKGYSKIDDIKGNAWKWLKHAYGGKK